MLYMVQHFSYEVHYDTMNQIFQTSINTVPKVTYCLIFFHFIFPRLKL